MTKLARPGTWRCWWTCGGRPAPSGSGSRISGMPWIKLTRPAGKRCLCGQCSHFQETEVVLKIFCWTPLILWTNDQRRCSERQICPFKKVNHLCSCIEHLLPLHLWTQQRRCLKSEHLLPYIYEHNRGGASSQSCTETEANNITIHHQSWTPPPLVWIYIHNRGVWLFWLDKFAFLSTSSGQLCSQNQRCSTKKSQIEVVEIFCWTPLLCS